MPMPNEHSRREQEKRDYFTKLDNHNREMFKQGQDRFLGKKRRNHQRQHTAQRRIEYQQPWHNYYIRF